MPGLVQQWLTEMQKDSEDEEWQQPKQKMNKPRTSWEWDIEKAKQ